METDVLIIGSGCSGLFCALRLPGNLNITVISKSRLDKSDSFLAQGGICMLRDDDDYESYFEDTMKAGHYENDPRSVEIMIKSSQGVIKKLIEYGVNFARDENGALVFTREGAHSKNRILFHEDITGKEITRNLLIKAYKAPNIKLLDHTTMIDIIEKDNRCCGAVIRTPYGNLQAVRAKAVVLATGGIGGLYRHSTNYRHLTGDALAVALKHNIKLKNLHYIQIHPTTFYNNDVLERSFLISESVRGEGAKLYNRNYERFVDELLPRDKVTAAIRAEMEKQGSSYVWEDLSPIDKDELKRHFPNICEYCFKKGYDVRRELIPVVPAQHYFMGGIEIDYEGRTSMDRLYAVGETACNGVHGRNRLASNSLLESMVFAARAACDIIEKIHGMTIPEDFDELYSLENYTDYDKIIKENKELVLHAIEESANKEN